VARLGLDEIAASPIAWERVGLAFDVEVELERTSYKELRPHQDEAVEAVFDNLASHDRGQLIMACGTGKTFTSLKIAERLARERAEESELPLPYRGEQQREPVTGQTRVEARGRPKARRPVRGSLRILTEAGAETGTGASVNAGAEVGAGPTADRAQGRAVGGSVSGAACGVLRGMPCGRRARRSASMSAASRSPVGVMAQKDCVLSP
jgi:hypothetical protein